MIRIETKKSLVWWYVSLIVYFGVALKNTLLNFIILIALIKTYIIDVWFEKILKCNNNILIGKMSNFLLFLPISFFSKFCVWKYLVWQELQRRYLELEEFLSNSVTTRLNISKVQVMTYVVVDDCWKLWCCKKHLFSHFLMSFWLVRFALFYFLQ